MQRIKIDIYISDLLYRYDCVVIPDFGGFVANYASAKIQPIQHKFTPPSKKISFNKNLNSNDGLLSSHIATRKHINYEEANELIKSFVNQSIEGLNKGDKIKIEKVGTLFLDPENNIQFVAEEKNDFLLDSFGFGALRAQPIVREGAEKRIKEEVKKVIPIVKKEEKKRRAIFWPAASLLLLLLVGGYFLNNQYLWLSSDDIHYSGLFTSESKPLSYAMREEATSFATVEKDENVSLNFEEGIVPYTTSNLEPTLLFIDNRKVETAIAEDNTKVVKKEANLNLKYHVMGGCFSNKRNAEKLVKKLQAEGFDARLLGTYKKLYAVSFGSFARDEEARALLSKVKESENSAAWLLVKPF